MYVGLQPLAAEDGLEAGVCTNARRPGAPTAPPHGRRLAVAGGVAGALLLAAAAATHSGRTEATTVARFAPHAVISEYAPGLATFFAAKQYNESLAQAFAVLAKVSYCDTKPGIYGSAAYSCGITGLPGVRTPCEDSGFVVTPGLVRVVDTPGASAVVARLSLLDDKLGQVSSYALAFRGSLNASSEGARDHDDDLVPLSLNESARLCPQALVHTGLYETWQKLRPGVELNLPKGAFVTCTGHGSGAALCALALFELKALGYKTVSSYTFSMPAVGNANFADCFNKDFSGLTPFYRITHSKDLSCPLPSKAYAHLGAEVHYAGVTLGKFAVCDDGDKKCGCASYVKAARAPETPKFVPGRRSTATTTTTPRVQVAWSGNASCTSALAPEGSFCEFSSFPATCYMGTGFNWGTFGPALGGATAPVPVGIASETAPTPAPTSVPTFAPALAPTAVFAKEAAPMAHEEDEEDAGASETRKKTAARRPWDPPAPRLGRKVLR